MKPRWTWMLAAALTVAAGVSGQNGTPLLTSTDGFTPPGMTPGSPAGSYELSGFDTISPSTGDLNFRLVLHTVQGRGGMKVPITLPLQRHWQTQTNSIPYGCQPVGSPPVAVCQYQYVHFAIDAWWTDKEVPYMPGYFGLRPAGIGNRAAGGGYPSVLYANTQITTVSSDGTEFDLRDKITRGQSLATISSTLGSPRGDTFVSVDGGAATFISQDSTNSNRVPLTDSIMVGAGSGGATGTLLTKGGTRYVAASGLISRIEDGNGNYFNYFYDAQNRPYEIDDSLGRKVTITYGNSDSTSTDIDIINYQGASGSAHTIKVYWSTLDQLLRADFSGPSSRSALFPTLVCTGQVNMCDTSQYTPRLPKKVVYPNGDTFTFKYNQYGEIAQVTLPTGGGYEYDWLFTPSPLNTQEPVNFEVRKKITAKRIYTSIPANTACTSPGSGCVLQGQITFTTISAIPTLAGTATNYEASMLQTLDASGNILRCTRHFTYPRATPGGDPTLYPSWQASKEFETQVCDANASSIPVQVNYTYWQQRPVASGTGVAEQFLDLTKNPIDPNTINARLHDPRVVETVSATLVGPVSGGNYSYDATQKFTSSIDQYGNPLVELEYDKSTWVLAPTTNTMTPATAVLLRTTTKSYLTASADNQASYDDANDFNVLTLSACAPPGCAEVPVSSLIHVRDLVQEVTVTGSIGAGSDTKYFYDGTTESSTAIVNVSSNTGGALHDPAFETGHYYRGNLTRTVQIDSNGNRAHSRTYDVNGNVLTATDPRLNVLNYTYPSSLQYEFVTSIQYPALGSAASMTEGYSWDLGAGVPLSHTDVNGNITNFSYETSPTLLDRLLKVTAPGDGGTTNYVYCDPSTTGVADCPTAGQVSELTKQDLTAVNDGVMQTRTIYDGLGRAVTTQQTSGGGTIVANKTIDAAGQVYNASNPGYGSAGALTTSFFDTLGRVTRVCTGDGACGSSTYSGLTATVTDPASASRTMVHDGLGRMTSVVDGSGVTAAYRYDVLDNLLNVCQGVGAAVNGSTGACSGTGQVQSRTFSYDRLKQLRTASNPETGNSTGALGDLSYGYDIAGNMTSRTMAASTSGQSSTVTITYDNLNRPYLKTYTGLRTSTPVTLCYDGRVYGGSDGSCVAGSITNGNGQLTEIHNTESTTRYTAFDARARVTSMYQATPSTSTNLQSMGYGYDLASHPISITYPTGRVVAQKFDTAGRTSEVTGYATMIGYAAHGALQSMKFGNNLVEQWSYDTMRLQPQSMQLGTSTSPSSVVKIETAFCAGASGFGSPCTTNNGNVMMDRITAPGMTVSRLYKYDSTNRLTQAGEYNALAPPASPGCPDAGSVWCEAYSYDNFANRTITARTGLTAPPSEPQTFDGTSNRVTGSGWNYDEAGNLTQDGALMSMGYDGENRQISAAGYSYGYDGAGHRVRSTDTHANVTTYVYGADGQILVEYSPATTGATTGRVYVTGDHLGSTRVVTDGTTALPVERLDYLPFGETINVSAGSPRVGVAGYGSSTDFLRQKFTGKERDAETGLDYFGARYFSAAQGRFTGVDPKMIPGAFDDPQSWNKYGYTRNNPLRHIDPDGEDWKDVLNGVMNAWSTDQVAGHGRGAGNSDYQIGQAIGDAGAVVTGMLEMNAGGGAAAAAGAGTVLSGGAVLPAAVPAALAGAGVAAHGASSTITGFVHLFKAATMRATPEPPNEHGNSNNTSKPAIQYSLQERKTGEVLKYGETTKPNGKGRYSQPKLDSMNAILVPEASGTKKQMKALQTDKIKAYEQQNGRKPRLNKTYQ